MIDIYLTSQLNIFFQVFK